MAGREDWLAYLKLLEQLTRTMEQLTDVEQEKTAAVSRGDLGAVDECMKREQTLSLSLRGIDQRRDAMLAKMGLQGTALRDLEDSAPTELLMETKRAAEALRGQYKVFRAASQVARDTLECNLRALEKAMEAQDAPRQEIPRQADFRA